MFDALRTLVKLVRGAADLINASCTRLIDQMGNRVCQVLLDTVNIVGPVAVRAIKLEAIWARLLLEPNSIVASVE